METHLGVAVVCSAQTCGLVWTVAGLWDVNENAGIRS